MNYFRHNFACFDERLMRQCNITFYIVDIQIVYGKGQKHYDRSNEYVAY